MAKRAAAKTGARAIPAKKPAPKTAAAQRTARKTPTAWTEAARTRFLAHLADTANVSESARAVNMSRAAAYAERKRNDEFAAGWQAAMDMALDELELAVVTRATFGYDKDIYFQGKKKGAVRQYSDALAMFLLRAHRPDIYGKAGSDGAAPLAGNEDMRAAIEAKLNGLAGAAHLPESAQDETD